MTPTDNQPERKEIIRVSVSEAAKLFGVNPQTVRRAIAAKEIIYAVVGGHDQQDVAESDVVVQEGEEST